MPLTRGTAAKYALALAGALAAAAAWQLYRHPALGLLLETFRFCG